MFISLTFFIIFKNDLTFFEFFKFKYRNDKGIFETIFKRENKSIIITVFFYFTDSFPKIQLKFFINRKYLINDGILFTSKQIS